MKIKDIVTNDNQVRFEYYYDGDLWYEVNFLNSETNKVENFKFPVPISDIGNATFKYKDKALLFMRYIRKHLT